MSDQYCGEIRMFSGWNGEYPIRGWAFCNGNMLYVNDNPALFSLLQNTWGGDMRITFKLPDMRGRTPIHQGQGQGLSERYFGQSIGSEYAMLTEENLPAHNHPLQASNLQAATESPTGAIPATVADQMFFYDDQTGSKKTVSLSPHAVAYSPNSDNYYPYTHFNYMPSMAINYIIALSGTFPNRH